MARIYQWLRLLLAPIVATAALVVPMTPADAKPKAPPVVDEQGDALLSTVLRSTARGYDKAKRAFAASAEKQLDLALAVKAAEAKRDKLVPQAGDVASQSYISGSLSTVGFLLNSPSTSVLFDRAVSLNEMNELNDKKLRDLNAAVRRVAIEKDRLDREVKAQQVHFKRMQEQKREAERALALVGGETLTKGLVQARSPKAAPAPGSRANGWQPEDNTVPDPTTGGRITPRTYHMYKETKRAGFNRFVGCYRPGGPFEHPKGRACDWSLQKNGFAVANNDDMKKYGNNLMAFFVRNADRLGVLYVIWYKQIWFPATGWKAYSGPSAHTDHVHVSML